MSLNSKFSFAYFILVLCVGFSVVCHRCGQILYEGRDMIHLYRLRRKTDRKCPGCGGKLSINSLGINFFKMGCVNDDYSKN